MTTLPSLKRLSLIPLSLLAACASAGCQSSGTAAGPTLASVSYGNGSGYGGTLSLAGMSFYRVDSSYACVPAGGGTPMRGYRSVLRFPDSQPSYVMIQGDSCGTAESPLCTATGCADGLEFPSLYYPTGENLLMGYEDGIYESRATPPQLGSASERFVESWCRSTDAGTDEGIDVIVRADMNAVQRSATLIISRSPSVSDGGGHLVQAFPVTTSLGSDARTYESPAFSLAIELGSGTPVPHRFPGRLKATIDGKPVESALYCRTVRGD